MSQKPLEDLLGGQDIDELDDDGDTRLIALLQKGGNDNDAFTLIRAGCELDWGYLDWQSNSDGAAAIHWACIQGRIKVLVEMIERNVKLDARDDSGMTCFMYACAHMHYDCACAVMDAGGTVNLMKMTLGDWNGGYMRTFMETNRFMTPPLLVIRVAER
jgi:ankyrin repeat protein